MTTLSHLRNYLTETKNDWNYITPLEFYEEFYKKNKNFLLIDLRKKEDYDKFHIKKSINIFWLDILKTENIEILPYDKTIFLICYVGHTSSQVMVLLKLLGYNVVSIKFGYGISPSFGVPVAGWLSYGFPVENMTSITSKCKSTY
jgi:rhodanese-related sulfurtransferase